MVFSPESGYKFIIEVQKACAANNEEVWKLLFNLLKKIDGQFVEIINVEFIAGDPDEIDRVAAITDEGLTRPQVRAFRDQVFPLTKPIGDEAREPTPQEQQVIATAMKSAVMA
ncbi:MAG: hypothetical protein IM492_01225 [Microcystis sp. M040S2]|nr:MULTISPECIES: hypothetical protein [unclassified Microcystis]MCA2618595.1 hypothetical protein [Microcystis sp. M099S2]MCA2808932.1 hypothetical protein [Microcystis sp. M095S1]MCA2827517.1 hypothetical protein [Microcystis sp. M088S1]MCA2829544.1 hypothetical protein [Microcystis sp. M086S1]MCA2861948.1 hypothetical protein [Microcystis sp. M049S1]MCA2913828.1 hypothetical protein [Microcystis sp. M022S1]MCA2955605.1 hypothetical protein [Microcystis sp. M010S1]MCA6517607.1 hypothetical